MGRFLAGCLVGSAAATAVIVAALPDRPGGTAGLATRLAAERYSETLRADAAAREALAARVELDRVRRARLAIPRAEDLIPRQELPTTPRED